MSASDELPRRIPGPVPPVKESVVIVGIQRQQPQWQQPRQQQQMEGEAKMNFKPSAAAQAAIQETEEYEKKLKTRQDYCRRIQEMADYYRNSPEGSNEYTFAHNGGVITLTQEQMTDPNFFTYNCTHDLAYDTLPVSMVKGFLAVKKKKRTGLFIHLPILENITIQSCLRLIKLRKCCRLITFLR